jgi:signal transduction histidine kinase
MASDAQIVRERFVREYGVAVATSAVALILTHLIDDPMVEPNTLLFFIAAVVFSSWYGGMGPGLVAAVLGAAAGAYFLISPGGGPHTNISIVVVRLAEFVLVSLLVCLLNAARLSAQRRAEAARAEAEAANRTKDVFIATASHELRTPLVSILGWMRLLQENLLSETERARALETVERNARVQRLLVDDLLDVSRIEAGKLNLTYEPTDLSAVLEDALNVVLPTARAKGVEIETHAERLGVQVSGDFDRLQQIIWNLLANAVKFTPPGGRIEVRLDIADGRIRIRIKDSGVGIAPEVLPHIFERFRQADGTRSHQGLGLGLSIASKLAELHGGRIFAESEGEGLGATFTFTLPLIPGAKDATQAVEAVAGESQGSLASQRLH